MDDPGVGCWMYRDEELTDTFQNLLVCRTAEKILNDFQMKTSDRWGKWQFFSLNFLHRKKWLFNIFSGQVLKSLGQNRPDKSSCLGTGIWGSWLRKYRQILLGLATSVCSESGSGQPQLFWCLLQKSLPRFKPIDFATIIKIKCSGKIQILTLTHQGNIVEVEPHPDWPQKV